MPGPSDGTIAKSLETPLALRKAIRQRAEGAKRAEQLALLGKTEVTPRTLAKREESHRRLDALLAENNLELQRRDRGPALRFPSVWHRGELRGHGPPRENQGGPRIIIMGQRRGKEAPVTTTIPREIPLAAVAGPSVLPGRNVQPQPRADKREKGHARTAGPSTSDATYQCDTEDWNEEDDEGEEDEEEEDAEEEEDDHESSESTESSDSASASESDEQSDIYAEPRLDPPRDGDKLRLLREFLLRGNAWIENLSRGPSNQRDEFFWEEVRRSLDTPRVFPTWSRAAEVFRNVICNRQWKAGKSMLDRPPRGPKGDKDRLIDRCVSIVSQRKALDMFIKQGLVTLESVPGMVRDGSLQCIIKELGAGGAGHPHANQQAAEHDHEPDGDGSTSESDEPAASIVSFESEPLNGYDTPASSPVPDRLASVRGQSRMKRGPEDGEAAPRKRRRIAKAQDDAPESDEETSGLSAPQTFVATVKKLIRLELGKETAKHRKQFDKSIRAGCRKVENRVLGKVDGLLTKLSKGKAREM